MPSGFVRYEHDLSGSPATLYAGLGHAARFPDYWELFSASLAPTGEVNAFDGIEPEKTIKVSECNPVLNDIDRARERDAILDVVSSITS